MTDPERIKAIEESISAKAEVAEAPKDTATPETPAAPVVEDDDDAEEPEASAAPDGTDAPAPRKNKGVGKRINELTREKHEALRRAEYAEQLLQQQQRLQQQPAQAAKPEGRPTLESFDFDQEAYADALTDWKVEQKLAEREKVAEQTRAQKVAQEQVKSFKDREAAFAAAHPDYYDVAYTAPINYSEAMLEAIRESDEAPAIAYHLANHLDQAADIAAMTPFAAAKAIGRLEAQLAAPASPAVTSPPRTVTRAPPVAPTIQGTGIAHKPLDAMTVDDHRAAVRAQRSNR